MDNKIVIITGSPGAGKSSVIAAVSSNNDYTVLNIGDLMVKLGVEKGYVKSRDEMRYMTNARITELRDRAADHISKQPGRIIVDTHATVQQHGRFVPGLPMGFIKALGNVVGLFYIDADTMAIMKRRQSDSDRVREAEGRQVLDTQRLVNIATLSGYSSDLNIPLYVIYNEEGKLEETRKAFLGHLKDAFGQK